jgi:hypothetical protein
MSTFYHDAKISTALAGSGTDVKILKIYSKNMYYGKKSVFFAQTIASFCQNFIITSVFEKSADCFGEKPQKVVIITSTPDCHRMKSAKN